MDRHSEGNTITTYALLHRRANAEIERCGLTIIELSNASQIGVDRLQSILDGRAREVTLRELAALALAIGVTVTALLTP